MKGAFGFPKIIFGMMFGGFKELEIS